MNQTTKVRQWVGGEIWGFESVGFVFSATYMD